jgi:hypothetical protein
MLFLKGNKEILQKYADGLHNYCKVNPNYISSRYTTVEEINGEYYVIFQPDWVEQPIGTEVINELPNSEILE